MAKKSKKYRKPVSSSAVKNHSSPVEPTIPDRVFGHTKDRFRWLIIGLIFAVGILVYFTAFKNEFIWDDAMIIMPNEYIRNWSHLKEIFTTDIHHFGLDHSNFYRPFQAVSYTIDHTFWDLNPMGYHISSVLIHICNAVLIYFITFNIVGFLDSKVKTMSREIAGGTALIWLVHPIHTQVVTYASGRADELVALFIFLSIYTFMVCSKRWISPILFACALLSKEYAVITPLFILLIDCFRLTIDSRKRWKKLLPYGIMLAVYIILRLTVLSFPTDFSSELIPGLFSRMLTSARSIVILISLLFAPFDLSMDRNIDWEKSLLDFKVIASILAVVGMVVVSFFIRKKYQLISFGLLWFFTGYFLVLNIMPMNANISEHWMYVPSVGLIFLLFYSLVRFIPKLNRRVLWIIICAMIVYLSIFLVKRNAEFKNEITFYNQILNRKYQNPRVHYNLGCAYFYEAEQIGDEQYKEFEAKSYKHLSEAIRLKPDYAAAYGNLGQLEYRRNNIQKAIALYQKANSIKPDLIENRANLGIAYVKTKQLDKALGELGIALQLNPNHLGSLNNIGIVYGTKGDYVNAEKYFKRALAVSPKDPSATKNLGHLYQLKKRQQLKQ